MKHDIAVVGLGIMGAATLDALARKGVDVIGIDRFSPPHDQGSSHGQTRIVRAAYAESPHYVPLAKHAMALWRALELRTDARLFTACGIVYAGAPHSAFLSGSRDAAQRHNVPLIEGPQDASFRHGLCLPKDWDAILEPGGGYVLAEESVAAFLQSAHMHGANIHKDTEVSAPVHAGGGFVINTAKGKVRAQKVILTTGPWTGQMCPDLAPYLSLQRRVLHWFGDPQSTLTEAAGFHPFAIETPVGGLFYGFPARDETGVKVAEHVRHDPVARISDMQRGGNADDQAHIDPLVRAHLPDAGTRLNMAACLYTMSPDEHFIIDAVPGQDGLFVGAGFSGHGFKFSPMIGEALSALALGEDCDFPYDFFSLARFAS